MLSKVIIILDYFMIDESWRQINPFGFSFCQKIEKSCLVYFHIYFFCTVF